MVTPGWRRLFAEVGALLDGLPGTVRVTGGAPDLRLPVGDTAIACVAVALTAAAGLQAQRNGSQPPEVWVDAAHTAAAVRSEAHLHVAGRPLWASGSLHCRGSGGRPTGGCVRTPITRGTAMRCCVRLAQVRTSMRWDR
jgi:hypothetical protein